MCRAADKHTNTVVHYILPHICKPVKLRYKIHSGWFLKRMILYQIHTYARKNWKVYEMMIYIRRVYVVVLSPLRVSYDWCKKYRSNQKPTTTSNIVVMCDSSVCLAVYFQRYNAATIQLLVNSKFWTHISDMIFVDVVVTIVSHYTVCLLLLLLLLFTVSHGVQY